MKTKAYKLAAELGLEEQSLLDWLKANGYPNARRADTIRAEVCQKARKALGRGGAHRGGHRNPNRNNPNRGTAHRGAARSAPPRSAPPRSAPPRSDAVRGSQAPQRPPLPRDNPPARAQDTLSVSFGELLEAHLPEASAHDRAVHETHMIPPPVALDPPETISLEQARKVAEAEKARDEARAEAQEWRVRFQRARHEKEEATTRLPELERKAARVEVLEEERSRNALELSTLRRRLTELEDERATLDQTAMEMRSQLESARTRLTRLEAEAQEESTTRKALETARQRENAWRTRALELERSATGSKGLTETLEQVGAEGAQAQAALLRTLLESPQSARALMRSIKHIDSEGLLETLKGRVALVCVHPQCNQIARWADRFVLRVDDDTQCEVCEGKPAQRWFKRMVQECERAGVRRLLVIGGAQATHQSLRELSQGQPVDLRLVGETETPEPARIRGRVEGCDVVVTWSAAITPTALTEAYLAAAQAGQRLTVSVLGARSEPEALARAVAHRLARSLVLSTQ